ncbi:alanine--tRNA ligase [Clostridium aminobutyricum]|uniref:Alanine--tRNA ligase n=1 Tax=Clostridium aminobutyricum TaxID=33953 RepID=A0A939D7J2_CLOAM|nr:alanine--tRNA ligase [Clostridium aminobutyricum]MBN7772537.1 alanine--tRNA ligase [Clostridium aminobutyricum]
MEKLGLNQLREMFLNFYESKEHYKKKSFSLVPEKDKSLLIINSGMAPLKPYFAGLETPPSKRMTTCQKCIRTGDIENVGYTSRHGTFFEMLGSFSFGDYFKTESITWGWEFITQVLKMPEDKIWATIYEEDDEAFTIWKEVIGMPVERIVRLGKDDNFWEIGTGPCGPCSEIYFDRGEKYGCGSEDCKPGCDCDRYIEFWNHVFTQFSKEEDGTYSNLAHPNIDTGMGLERLACIMQGVDSIFDIDTIKYILDAIVAKSGVQYGDGQFPTDVSIRIITDHIRSVTFMIGDGIIPSNEGRGYVLRRLLRRAARHGKLLNIEGAFLAEISKKVIEASGQAYPELEEKKDYIFKIITIEEEKFSTTIDQGTAIIAQYVEELKAEGQTVLSGEKVFKLHDTYGFPLELTQEILEENGCSVDIEEFDEHMNKQKETARAARKSAEEDGWAEDNLSVSMEGTTEFTGYEKVTDQGVVKAIISAKPNAASVGEGEDAKIFLDKTPFYAESGGQIYDCGTIYNDGFMAEVLDVTKVQGNFAHKIKVLKGQLHVGDTVTAAISVTNRNSIARNHTATHLLQKALKEVVGDHVHQAGSSVTAEGLRFDFSHYEAVSKEQLAAVEELVNDKILHFLPVKVEEMSMKEAADSGATALFGEKYGDTVRVVSVGDFSKELCGGTHVSNAGLIGALRIVSETGVAAGVRRIEAVTGLGVLKKVEESEELIHAASDILKTNRSGVLAKITNISEEAKSLKKELEDLKKSAISSSLDSILAEAKEIKNVKLLTKAFTDYDINDLRAISDDIKKNNKGVIVVFASQVGEKVTFMVSVTDDLLEKGYHAGNMIKQIAAAAGGGGGGKADMAQAGAKDASKIMDAFKVAESLI